jgi:hypothetical protein
MRTQDIVAGINLLLHYYDTPDGFHISCKHDELRMYATSRPLTEDDLDKIISLGWHQEHDGRGDYSEDFAPKHYMSDACWVSYV